MSIEHLELELRNLLTLARREVGGEDASEEHVMARLCAGLALGRTPDRRFFDIVRASERLNAAVKASRQSDWSSWPVGSWALAADGNLLGPFNAKPGDEVLRTCKLWRGSLVWQVHVPAPSGSCPSSCSCSCSFPSSCSPST
jgi:hypothetical protein